MRHPCSRPRLGSLLSIPAGRQWKSSHLSRQRGISEFSPRHTSHLIIPLCLYKFSSAGGWQRSSSLPRWSVRHFLNRGVLAASLGAFFLPILATWPQWSLGKLQIAAEIQTITQWYVQRVNTCNVRLQNIPYVCCTGSFHRLSACDTDYP